MGRHSTTKCIADGSRMPCQREVTFSCGLRSGLSKKNRELQACFADFEGRRGAISLQLRLRGGGRGIRTPGTVSRTSVFKTDCFNHSHIPPRGNERSGSSLELVYIRPDLHQVGAPACPPHSDSGAALDRVENVRSSATDFYSPQTPENGIPSPRQNARENTVGCDHPDRHDIRASRLLSVIRHAARRRLFRNRSCHSVRS
jgi:hypothetical protein